MIQRKTPLKRSGLRQPTLAEVIAFQNKPRKPLPKAKRAPARVGRKSKREAAAWRECKVAIIARSGGYCEGNVPGVCPRWKHGATQSHHCWPSDRDRGIHDPDRCLHLCTAVHDWAHTHPKPAADWGILRPRSGIPGQALPDRCSL